ncbi:MAG TPA: FtsX-like permease family protein [Planctomycetes bacterium]|nr:FtsX-like permease family protein [Planctomycetota bacterium]
MNLLRLVKSSLFFYRRTNAGILASVAAATAILSGALFLGDSVRYSLKRLVTVRLGNVELALAGQNRFFRAGLADNLAGQLNAKVAPVLHLRGLITNSDGTRRVNRINVLGVDRRFYSLAETTPAFGRNLQDSVSLNEPLAQRLKAGVGDEIVLRIGKPGLMPRDVPLTPVSDLSVAFRLKVKGIADKSQFGGFSLAADNAAPLNAFVPLRWLQGKSQQQDGANVLLVSPPADRDSLTAEGANEALKRCCKISDVGLEVRRLDDQKTIEITSRRVFIDDLLSRSALDVSDDAVGILTYFVNEIRLNDNTTPYSFVTAVGQAGDFSNIIPAGMSDDEIMINQWLADDIKAKAGDEISLSYFVLSPGRRLREKASTFRVLDVLKTDEAGDGELMPDFPGLADKTNCRDWEPGIPIDVKKIRPKDEAYWMKYRGRPKAFVTLSAGQRMWSNRFGNLTGVRYESGKVSEEDVSEGILKTIDVSSAGLYFQPVRAQGIKAGQEATDFGQLFLGLSMFLIASALILMGLVFIFGVERRSGQVGMLLAVGFSPKLIRLLLLCEGGILAVLGTVVGVAAGVMYTGAMIYGLRTVWQGAVGGSAIYFQAEQSSFFAGAGGGLLVSFIAIWLSLRKQFHQPARVLLGRVQEAGFERSSTRKSKTGLWVAIAAVIGAAVIIAITPEEKSGAFFGAAACLLIAEIGIASVLLGAIGGGWGRTMTSIGRLAVQNCTRRSRRSLAIVGLLAAGSFLVIGVGANRKHTVTDSHIKDSGTGGFTLLGESSIGILQDLNSDAERRSLGLEGLEGVDIVRLRVRDGDDASCLNLNRAQRPRLFGLDPARLKRQGAFGFMAAAEGLALDAGWDLLNNDTGAGVVPAIGDYATIIWALGKRLGDEIDYTDEKGRNFRLRLVGMLKNSVLQGSLVINEDEFVRRFPSEEGYRFFLIDTAAKDPAWVGEKLSDRLRDFGLDITHTVQRLARFNAVENTYLSIFELLGGLGLVLGSVGIGLVVLLNALERRGEMAMLRAVGFGKKKLKQMVVCEYGSLMLFGLVCGIIAAGVAISPVLRSPGAQVPYFSLAVTIVAIAASGLLWIWLAATVSLSGRVIDALRNE